MVEENNLKELLCPELRRIQSRMRRLCLVLGLALTFSFVAAKTSAKVPSITMSYAAEFDAACSQQTKYQIDPAWIEELKSRLPEMNAAWSKEGPTLLSTSEAIVGRPFRDKQVNISLSVCSMPSMAEPMLINMRFSLKSFTPEPLPEDVTTGIMFHELLHRYLDGLIPQNGALLLKYRDEDETVKAHLHLLALQEGVYLKLGRIQTLRRVIAKDRDLPNKSYGRAWDIVDSEKYESFISELHR
jgi:hypothetical protein